MKLMPLVLLITYLIAITLLHRSTFLHPSFTLPIIEHILFSLPVIIIIISMSYLGDRSKIHPLKNEFITLTIYFMLGALVNLIIDHNNSDLKAWWSLGLIFLLIYSLVFSFLFTAICWLFSFHHYTYTLVCSYITFLILSTHSLYPNISLGSFKYMDTLYVYSILLLFSQFFIASISNLRLKRSAI